VIALLSEKGALLQRFTPVFKALQVANSNTSNKQSGSIADIARRIVSLPSFRRADDQKVLTKTFAFLCLDLYFALGDLFVHTLVTRRVPQERVRRMFGTRMMESYMCDFMRTWITETTYELPIRLFSTLFTTHVMPYARVFTALLHADNGGPTRRLLPGALHVRFTEAISKHMTDRYFFLLTLNQRYQQPVWSWSCVSNFYWKRFNHAMALEYLIALAPLMLPVYVYSEIMQWLLPPAPYFNWLKYAAITTKTLNILRGDRPSLAKRVC
jgi:hypothetical protein